MTLAEAIARLVVAAKVYQRDRALKPVERRLAADMRKAFREHRRVFLQEFERYGPHIFGEAAPLPIEGALEIAYQSTLDMFTGPIEEAAAASIAAAARHRVAEFGINYAFDLKNPRAVQAIRDRAAKSAGDIDATTRADLTAILTRGMEEGYSYQQVAREIGAKYDEYLQPVSRPRHIRSRAELIAVNEAAEAYEAGNRIVVDEMSAVGLEMEKSWSTVGDERVSDGCRSNGQTGWIPVDQPFPSGHQHAPRFPGCRCAILYRRRPTPEGAT